MVIFHNSTIRKIISGIEAHHSITLSVKNAGHNSCLIYLTVVVRLHSLPVFVSTVVTCLITSLGFLGAEGFLGAGFFLETTGFFLLTRLLL